MIRADRSWVACGVAALCLLANSARADLAPVDVELSAELWMLNGDSYFQPLVPPFQKLAFPPLRTRVLADLFPLDPTGFRRLVIPNDLGGVLDLSLSQTTAGSPLRFPEPENPLTPFTLLLRIELDNDAGTVRPGGGGSGGIGGSFALNLDTTLVLERIDLGGESLEASIPLLGAIGMDRTLMLSASFTEIALAGVGSVFGERWTTQAVTVSRSLVTDRTHLALSPRGWTRFEHRTEGTATSGHLALVTPVVVEQLWRSGPGPVRAPVPLYGSFRLAFTPEPRGSALVLGALLGLAVLGRRVDAQAARTS